MHVLAIISPKGGVGKTTITTALAVAAEADGKHVAVFDVDPKPDASFWSDIREASTPAIRDIQPLRIAHYVEAMREAGCDLVIIDCPAVARDTAIEAAQHSDFVLIPTHPALFEMRSMKTTFDLLTKFEKPCSVVLTFVDPSGPEAPAARDGVKSLGAPLCPAELGRRKAFTRAQQQGLTAQEFEPSGKAAAEIQDLYKYTCLQLEKATRDEQGSDDKEKSA